MRPAAVGTPARTHLHVACSLGSTRGGRDSCVRGPGVAHIHSPAGSGGASPAVERSTFSARSYLASAANTLEIIFSAGVVVSIAAASLASTFRPTSRSVK